MGYSQSSIYLEYYTALGRYQINKYWQPQLGHYAIKTNQGFFETSRSTIISLNSTDLMFLQKKSLLLNYSWIPTITDLIQLYIKLDYFKNKEGELCDKKEEKLDKEYVKRSNILLKKAMILSGNLPELKLLNLLEQERLIEIIESVDLSYLINMGKEKRYNRSELEKMVEKENFEFEEKVEKALNCLL